MLVADPAVPGGVRAKLLDFGIAKLLDEDLVSASGHSHTATGALLGTPIYMSPEQCRGAGGVDIHTDVYSLGVMLYQMLAGEPPFSALGTGEILTLHMQAPPPPLGPRAPAAPAGLVTLVMNMLAKPTDERPTMAAVEAELATLSGVPIGSAVSTSGNGLRLSELMSSSSLGRITGVGHTVDPFGSTLDGVVGQPTRSSRPLPKVSLTRRWLAIGGLAAAGLGAILALGAHFEHGSAARAAQLLTRAQADLRERRWVDAQLHAAQVLAAAELLPGQREGAQDVKERAEREGGAQRALERMRSDEQVGHLDAAMRVYPEIPTDSVYAAAGLEIFERLSPLFATGHLGRAEAARQAGRCDEFLSEVAAVTQVLPNNAEAQQLGARDCLSKEVGAQAARTAALAPQLVTRWVATQAAARPGSAGTEAAEVEALYAERFLGLRRDRGRVTALDRAQWLRERRFGTQTSLEAADVRVVATDLTARVTLALRAQTGPQTATRHVELVLVRSGDTLRIAREEHALDPPAGTAPVSASVSGADGGARRTESFAFVEGLDLLFPVPPEEAWARGAPHIDKSESEGEGDVVRASRSVDPALLPAEVLRWQGRRVQLWDLRGARCEARVARFKMVGRVIPPAEMRRHWAAGDPAEAARELWTLSEGGRALVAELEPDRGCASTGAFLWARAIEMPVLPALGLPREASPAVREAALRAFQQAPGAGATTPGTNPAKTNPKARGPRPGPLPAEADTEITELSLGDVTLVSLSAKASCGGSVWMLWQRESGDGGEAPRLRPVSTARWGLSGTPRALVDLDNDGVPEVLFWSGGLGERLGLLRAHDGIYDEAVVRKVPALDSSC